MLPAGHRLRRSSDFRSTTRSGLRAGRSALVVHLSSAAGARTDLAQVGFTVGKSVGNSVVRHRVTRRLREAVRPLLPDLPAGSRVVVRALPEASGASVVDLREQIASALRTLQRRAS